MFAEVQGDLMVLSFELSAFQKSSGTAFCNRDHVHVMRTGHLQSCPPAILLLKKKQSIKAPTACLHGWLFHTSSPLDFF